MSGSTGSDELLSELLKSDEETDRCLEIMFARYKEAYPHYPGTVDFWKLSLAAVQDITPALSTDQLVYNHYYYIQSGNEGPYDEWLGSTIHLLAFMLTVGKESAYVGEACRDLARVVDELNIEGGTYYNPGTIEGLVSYAERALVLAGELSPEEELRGDQVVSRLLRKVQVPFTEHRPPILDRTKINYMIREFTESVSRKLAQKVMEAAERGNSTRQLRPEPLPRSSSGTLSAADTRRIAQLTRSVERSQKQLQRLNAKMVPTGDQ